MTKEEWRALLRARRAGVSRVAATRAAVAVADQLLALPEVAQAGGVLAYLSFGDELDTWGLIDRLLAADKAVFVPRSPVGSRRLRIHRYPCPLETLSFGLRQPPAGTPQLDSTAIEREVDVVLVPGLGFDRRGYRIGYGAGYYDRFLESRSWPSIGLGFQVQMVPELPIEAHDVELSRVISEAGAWAS